MREALRSAVRALLDRLPGTAYDKNDVRAHIIALARYVALARSPVDRDNQGEIRLVLDPEAPTRIVKMLTQLWRASGLLGLPRADAWELVQRVGMDSIPKLRRSVLDYLADCSTMLSTTDISEHVGHPSRTTRRALEDLVAHRVVVRLPGGQGNADCWILSDQARLWLDQLTVPVSSANTQSANALIERKIPNDDITGKVASGA